MIQTKKFMIIILFSNVLGDFGITELVIDWNVLVKARLFHGCIPIC